MKYINNSRNFILYVLKAYMVCSITVFCVVFIEYSILYFLKNGQRYWYDSPLFYAPIAALLVPFYNIGSLIIFYCYRLNNIEVVCMSTILCFVDRFIDYLLHIFIPESSFYTYEWTSSYYAPNKVWWYDNLMFSIYRFLLLYIMLVMYIHLKRKIKKSVDKIYGK